jgi:hypothetical protein
VITGSQPVALAASPRPPSNWSAARGSHPDILFCRQILALAGSRHVLAPAEGVEPSTTSFGDSRSEPRRAGVIGSRYDIASGAQKPLHYSALETVADGAISPSCRPVTTDGPDRGCDSAPHYEVYGYQT